MDVKILNGDIALAPCGEYEEKIYDTQEIFQQMQIVLSTKKGSFIYDRNLGVEPLPLDFSNERNFKNLNLLLNEAVMNIEGAYVELLAVNTNDNSLIMNVRLHYYDESREENIMLNG